MIRKLIVPLALATALLGCRHQMHPMDVGLDWKATDDTSKLQADMARALGRRKVQVKNFTDSRETKDIIGRNVQDPSNPVGVTSKDDAGAWCAQQMKFLLRKSGVEVVDSGAAYVVNGKITELLVTEGDVYDGQATVLMNVTDARGNTVWKGVAAGKSKRWGRSFSRDNYLETISDSYVRALGQMFADDEFMVAMKH